jgi:oligopeptide/dipeptide ABC transporter ATP-binding protein
MTASQAVSQPAAANGKPLLEVRGLKTYFPVKRGLLQRKVADLKAVDDISFDVMPGETLGLVGESGCGKSTAGRTILRLIPATAGSVRYDGAPVFEMGGAALKAMRRQMQIVFQDPVGSLNPRMTVGRILSEPIAVHRLARGTDLRDRVASLLERVGLSPDHADRYPHEFSGGQRQRIGIARALALEPRFIVCDEPVSALDVSIQAQILNLLSELQDELGLAYLFIAHNLAVIEHFCDRVAVMYLGKIVELADRDAIYANPRHPYTRALLSAAPHPKPVRDTNRIVLPGEVPSPINPPQGCAFHPRCPLTRILAASAKESETMEVRTQHETVRVMRRCVNEMPVLQARPGDAAHAVSCVYESEADQMPKPTKAS